MSHLIIRVVEGESLPNQMLSRQQIRRASGATSLDEMHTNVVERTGVVCSKVTVRRTLKRLQYSKVFPRRTFMLSEINRQKRIDWAQRHSKKRWQNVIFCDEASFWLSGGRVLLWTKRGVSRWQPIPKHSAKVHIWAAWSSMGTCPLCIFSHNLTGHLYTKILEWYLLRQAQVFHDQNWKLLQDNDPKHTSKIVKSWMAENMPGKLLDWPSQSPDLNPIENLFAWIKFRLNRIPHQRPKTIRSLKVKLDKIWNDITPEFLHNYWQSMPKRCRMVTESNEYKIKY